MNEELKVEPIIGLEVHVELKTSSKMFCGCSASYFGHEPNTHCCPVCLGLPGALPVPNKKAIEWCLMIGLALNCQVSPESYFERKNYFYPDLPKGYQISQYNKPLTHDGFLVIARSETAKQSVSENRLPRLSGARNDEAKKIRINRVHMEEDTGKLTHAEVNGEKCSLIDFNRSGVPLVEIVTEPDFNSVEEVVTYLKKLHQIIRYLEVSDADMEKGTMRLEPTINLKIVQGEKTFYTPLVEIKNINSFRFVKQALEYEIKRQLEEFEKTGIEKNTGSKTTVGYNEEKRMTVLQRSKEEANDYRYFPEPDIPPMIFGDEDIRILRERIPELPEEKIARFIKEYGLNEYDANILCDDKNIANYYEKCVRGSSDGGRSNITPKIIANWIINKKADINKVSPEELVKTITAKVQGATLSEEELETAIKKVLAVNEKAVSDYKSGKENALMFLVGQVMRETKGQADAGLIKTRLQKLLNI